MTLAEIEKLSVAERLQMMEVLWDTLAREPDMVDSPEWHEEILAARQRKIDEGRAEFISIKELKGKYRYLIPPERFGNA